jgi:hypothetical protein
LSAYADAILPRGDAVDANFRASSVDADAALSLDPGIAHPMDGDVCAAPGTTGAALEDRRQRAAESQNKLSRRLSLVVRANLHVIAIGHRALLRQIHSGGIAARSR